MEGMSRGGKRHSAVELPHLVPPDVCDPDAALPINGDAVRNGEEVGAP